MLEPREIGAAEFKAHCLELMSEVERLGTEIVITKHRRPVARLVPVRAASRRFCGSLAGMVTAQKDLVSPVDDPWSADESNFT
ncbi:MAG: type II toxin-antitoxin system prevent-host-death family antitoxin [Candidatus Eremiobacteraeota bacterium]|nr:type II toxin-antitoxin system prevent-host-death family antitoxin [Candidatus Eremiobacteraeota bacterium]MBV8499439.1 type II toxin-antitoxin system prevent-host-death family antitoxin [Candidatus Eremiobacteraeota bacterium]